MENELKENWEFEIISQYTLDLLLIVDQNQIVKYATPSFIKILGYELEELVGKNAFDLIHPEDKETMMASHRGVVVNKEPEVNEYRAFHKNGGIIYLESRVMPVQNDPNNLVVVSIRDITERKKIENELEQRKTRYQLLQNTLKHFSHDLSSVRKISELNNRLIDELKNTLPNSLPHMSVYNWELNRFEEDEMLGLATVIPKLAIGKFQYHEDYIHTLIGDDKDKAYILTINRIAVQEVMDKIWFETLIYYTIIVFESINVIEDLMNQLEKALQKHDKPQWILRLLFNLSEKQRVELSSDLHETVLQNQIALYENLKLILHQYHFEKDIKDQLQQIKISLKKSIHQIRMTCNELRPPLLKEIGLISSLQNLFNYIETSSTFHITFTANNTPQLELSEEITIGIYRIVQELLNNAIKHSEAEELTFQLTIGDENVLLNYTDDGKGLDTKNLTPSFKSMGLSGMRERVRSLNGHIEFFSQPDNGLKVNLRIPISN